MSPSFTTKHLPDDGIALINAARYIAKREPLRLKFAHFKHFFFIRDCARVLNADSAAAFLHSIFIIICVGAQKQMFRVAAGRIVAAMKYVKPLWDWAVVQFIHSAVSQNRPSLIGDSSISRALFPSRPYPAGGGLDEFTLNTFKKRRALKTFLGRVAQLRRPKRKTAYCRSGKRGILCF